MKRVKTILPYLPLVLSMTGCTSFHVPPPKYLLNAQPERAGLVYVFGMRNRDTIVEPNMRYLDLTFSYRKFSASELAQCKTGQELLFKCIDSGVGERLKGHGSGSICVGLPEGDYYFAVRGAQNMTSRKGMIDFVSELQAGVPVFKVYETILADGAVRFRSEIGKVDIMCVQEVPCGDLKGKSSTFRTLNLGTITDPRIDPAEAQEKLVSWVLRGSLAGQYVAVLLLSEVGDQKAVGPLQELATKEPRLAGLVQKTLSEIGRRTGTH